MQSVQPLSLPIAHGRETAMEIIDLEEFIDIASKHRHVMLGECSYMMREFYAIKMQMVKQLVEEHGFSLLIVEASMSACADVLSRDASHPVEYLDAVHAYARTPEMLDLFAWWQQPDVRSRLKIVGVDPGLKNADNPWTERTLRTMGYQRADAFAGLDATLDAVYRRHHFGDPDPQDSTRLDNARHAIVDALAWLTMRGDSSHDAMLIDRILHDRLTFLDVALDEKAYLDWRERCTAENIDWWTREMYPGEKSIVWAHNHHIVRSNEAIEGTKGTADYLAKDFRDEAFSLGVYAHSGTGTYWTNNTFEISLPPEGAVERFGIGDGESARITVFPTREGWWSDLCITRLFGNEEELLVPADQYDAVLVVRDVTLAESVDREMVLRIPR